MRREGSNCVLWSVRYPRRHRAQSAVAGDRLATRVEFRLRTLPVSRVCAGGRRARWCWWTGSRRYVKIHSTQHLCVFCDCLPHAQAWCWSASRSSSDLDGSGRRRCHDAHTEIGMDKSVSEETRRRPASAARRRRPCKCIRLYPLREKKDARRRRHRSQCLWTFVKGR